MQDLVAIRERIRTVDERCDRLQAVIHEPDQVVPQPPPELPDSPQPPPEEPQQPVPPAPQEPFLHQVILMFVARVRKDIDDNNLELPESRMDFPVVRASLRDFASDNDISRQPDDEASINHSQMLDDYLEDLVEILESNLPTNSPRLNRMVQSFISELVNIRLLARAAELESIVAGLDQTAHLATWSEMMKNQASCRSPFFEFVCELIFPIKESLFQLCDSITHFHWIHI